MRAFANLLNFASRSLLLLGGIGLAVMTLIIGWQVFARYVLNASPSWSEQASLVLMIWFVSFAAAAGVKEGFHIRISAFADNLPGRWPHRLQLLSHLIVALVGGAMAFWGGELILRTWEHAIPTLGISRGFAYLPLPISGVLISLFALENILEQLNPAIAGDAES
ncbi:C4-dicarboxylate ABC transporter substrate-binding protein [Maricaulis sp. W15]|uniref:TRAP transporter small permease protein n=1 Tax=Maricaulis maris TaxID=74318 RepID=A0A495D393_9PROT|nr:MULTISPECIES: TRAP transporter small permease [Maricaulis]OLF71016.1 C4-dicarboxylate ABC transporter substrate-binding protein [Maricaulis sp. W15]RKQ96226.1 TRAP-type C4-dicarboxylate transport system permease small subunit [Maricaulis maris]